MVALSWRERVHLLARALVGTLNVDPKSPGGDMLSRIYPGSLGEPPKRGTAEFLQAYSDSPWLRAVEQRISMATASVPWQLYYVKRPDAQKAIHRKDLQRAPFAVRKSLLKEREQAGDLVQVTDHPWLTAMDKGVANLTGLTVRKLVQVYLDVIGDAFLMKERNNLGVPIAFWPLPPTWISATPTVSRRFFTVSFRGWQGDIPDTEILWMSDPDLVNPYGRGSGVARAVADELDTDEFAAKHTRAFFQNRARPDLIVSPKGPDDSLQPPDVARLEHEWVGRHQGFWKAFKPFFMRRAVEVKELEQNFQHQQLVELRKHERDMILQVTGGIPPEMLGIIENSNRATIDGAKYIMADQITVPRLELQRSYYQEKVIPEYDERLIVDYVSPIPDDKDRQLEAAKSASWALTTDEWRAMAGLPPLTVGGDVHMVPVGLTPMKTIEDLMLADLIEEPAAPAA